MDYRHRKSKPVVLEKHPSCTQGGCFIWLNIKQVARCILVQFTLVWLLN